MRLKVFFGACLALLTALYAWPLSWTPVGQLKQFYQPAPRLSGTIWKGRISGLHNIDNLDIATSLKALLMGQPPISFSSAQPAMQLRGHIGFGRLEKLEASGWLSWILPGDPRFNGVSGSYSLRLDHIAFKTRDLEAGCQSAQGEFSTDVLQKNTALWQWSGPVLSGPITCEKGEIISVLNGQDRTQTINIRTVMKPDGRYQAEFNVQTKEAGAALLLPLYGFEPSPRGFRLNEQGRWY